MPGEMHLTCKDTFLKPFECCGIPSLALGPWTFANWAILWHMYVVYSSKFKLLTMDANCSKGSFDTAHDKSKISCIALFSNCKSSQNVWTFSSPLNQSLDEFHHLSSCFTEEVEVVCVWSSLVLVVVLLHVPGRNDPFALLGTPSPHKRRRRHNDERRHTHKSST